MRTRRKAGDLVKFAWFALAIIIISVIGLADEVIRHAVILVPVAIAALAGGYLLGRRHGRRPRRITAARPGDRPPARPGRRRSSGQASSSTRAQKNGWEAPRQQKMLMIGEECLGAAPLPWCHDLRCQCTACGHPSHLPARPALRAEPPF